MKKYSTSFILFIAFISLNFTNFEIPENTAIEYKIVPQKSNVKWVAKKVTGQHNGILSIKNGLLLINEKGELIGGKVFMDMNSIQCLDIEDEKSNEDLVNHLKSDDFFSCKKFPESVFKVSKVLPIEDNEEFTHTIVGSLTIKGYTNTLKFPIKMESKKNYIHISGKTSIDRTKYNIKYGSGKFFENLGDKMIQDLFTLDFKMSAQLPETK